PPPTTPPLFPYTPLFRSAPGSIFAASTVTFSWTSGSGVTEYWLSIGTQPGADTLYSHSAGTGLSATVFGLPTTAPVYVRLWALTGGSSHVSTPATCTAPR